MRIIEPAIRCHIRIMSELLLVCSLFLSGCIKEDAIIGSNDMSKVIRVSFDVVNTNHVEMHSRSSMSDFTLQSLTACTVDAQGSIMQDNIPVSNLVYETTGKYTGSLSIENYSKVKEIHFFANCAPSIPNDKSGLDNINIKFSPVSYPLDTPLPMWGTGYLSETSGKLVMNLLRSVVSSEICSNTEKLQIKESAVCNSNDIVNICPKGATISSDVFNPADSENQDNVRVSSEINRFCFPEFNEKSDKGKRTCLIIKADYNGEECFYRIDFYKDGKYFLPKRNTLYSFRITDVTQKGHNSLESALAETGANVQSIIHVDITDNSNEIVVDRKYQFAFEAVNNAILNPQDFMLMSFETNNSAVVEVAEHEGIDWLSNLTLRRNGTYNKKTINSEGEPTTTTFYKWNLYGSFSNSESIKANSPIWGRHTHEIKLTCGKLEKYIGITQSLVSLSFMNYESYVKTTDGREYRVGTNEYDMLDLNTVSARYQKGIDLRYKPHKLRIWISWSACSPNQSPAITNTELTIKKRIKRIDTIGGVVDTIENQENRNVDISKDGMVFFDIDMLEVLDYDDRCKNIIDVEVSSGNSLTSFLYIEQRYSQN